jgi:flagellar hook-associated protein 3 FlgL
MRINPTPLPDLLAALAETQLQQQTALQQIASGRRVQVPSDDPAAAAVLVLNHAGTTATTQFLHTVSNLAARLQVADSTISAVVLAVQRVLTLGVQAANGTLSNTDRASIATELQGLQQQLVSLANASFQGTFLFGGTASLAPPFVTDALQASGVRYDGNANTNSVQVGDSFSLAVNLPGSQIFQSVGADLFQGVHDLAAAVTANVGIPAALAQVRAAFDSISAQRVFFGNALLQLDGQQSYLNNAKLQLAQQENTLGAADLAAASSSLVTAETARNAALQATSSVLHNSLFDFLK